MRLALRTIIALLLAVPLTASAQPASGPATRPGSQAAVIVLEGTIDNFSRDAVIRRFERAREIGADTIILSINSYGGLALAGLETSRFLKRQDDLHTIAFVDEKAISAGAMIALACDEIVMSPGSQLGDCAPISMSETGGLEPLPPAERAKAESPILEDFHDSATRNGYDPLLTQAMVSVGRVVHWIENESGQRRFVDAAGYQKLMAEGGWRPVESERDPIDGGDELLTVGAARAIKLGLARGIAHSPADLAQQRGLVIIATLRPGMGESIVGWLSSMTVRAILTTIFMFTLYMAFSHPGHGLAEVAAMVSLGVLVGVPVLTGYAQWWEILAILVGLVLLAMEIFVIPGFGVTGISGVLLICGGLVMTFVGNEPVEIPGVLPSLKGTWDAMFRGLVIVVTGMGCSLLLWLWIQRYLPKLPYVNKLILTTPQGAVETIDQPTPAPWPMQGALGTAVTDLRPSGTAEFADESIGDVRSAEVVSDSGFVRAGARVVVCKVRGARVIVKSV